MSEPIRRIYSYLPNPRVWKSPIAAEICGMNFEVRGDKTGRIQSRRPHRHFEAKSVLLAVVRNTSNNCEALRTDSHLHASLVFAREARVYILYMPDVNEELNNRMSFAFDFYCKRKASVRNCDRPQSQGDW